MAKQFYAENTIFPDAQAGHLGAMDAVATTTIAAGDICIIDESVGGLAQASPASSASLATSAGILRVALGGAVTGGNVTLVPWRILTDVTTTGAVAKDLVFLSTGGDWSLSPGAVNVPVGIVLETGSTTGVVMLCPQDAGLQVLAQRAGRRNRYTLHQVDGLRGKPGLNADIQNAAEATRMIADPNFEVLGTNADSSCTTFDAEGGIALTTKTTSGDQVIVLPHLDANETAWAQTTWGTDKETEWRRKLRTGSAITTCIIWAGLKLTNTSTTATDNDQAFFRYENGVNSGKWQAIYSIGGTDTAVDTGVTVAVSTTYELEVRIDSSRIPRFYINGALVATGTAMTNTTDLIPYTGVQTGTTAARVITILEQSIGRVAG